MKNIMPQFDQVLLELKEPEKETQSGIILTEENDDYGDVKVGTVLRAGPETKIMKEGHLAAFKPFSASKITLADAEYYLVKEENILATLEG